MTQLAPDKGNRLPNDVVLDVRSPEEYRIRHVPGSRNLPYDEVCRRAERLRPELAGYSKVFLYCSSGVRSGHAFAALRKAGLDNLVLIQESGMPDWVRAGLPVERSVPLTRDLAVGVAAGLVGQLAATACDKALGAWVSDAQKRRERRVRKGSPHKVGGSHIAARALGRRLSRKEQRQAQAVFSLAYGVLWGLIYAAVRRGAPRSAAFFGLPFAAAFFLACDGVLAPLFGMTPGLQKIPWQFNAKEMLNHVAWTTAAETVHRAAETRLG